MIKIILIAFFIGLIILLMSPFSPLPTPDWYEPPMIESSNGVLDTTLTVKKQMVSIGGVATMSAVYNGQYPGPTFKMKPGDKFKVKLVNQGTEDTNLHFHGSHVSPKGNGDNVFIDVKPNETFQYEYDLPQDHSPGLYWYHPHFHTYSEEQVLDGMAGAIIVDGGVNELAGIKDLPVRQIIMTTVDTSNSNKPIRLVNGKKNPTLYLHPGETYLLQIFNISADDYFDFSIPGMTMHVISGDGNPLSRVKEVTHQILSPANRVQVLVKAGWPGEYPVKSLPYNQGFAHYVEDTFMNIKVQGFPVIPKALPTQLIPHEELKNVKVDKVRTLTFTEGAGDNPDFYLDGKMFDMNRVDQVITLGSVEEWHLINNSYENHPFHIHINPFEVISVNGVDPNYLGYWDTYTVPAHGNVVIRTRYTDFDGKFVLHCHILFHEDHGMMQVVQIQDPSNPHASDKNSENDVMVGDMAGMVMPHKEVPRKLQYKAKAQSN